MYNNLLKSRSGRVNFDSYLLHLKWKENPWSIKEHGHIQKGGRKGTGGGEGYNPDIFLQDRWGYFLTYSVSSTN